jgi:predicted nuclease of predicted toxin-antitoxin system
VRIIIDINLAPRWAEFLSANGFEATHWSTVGSVTASDEEIMRHAVRDGAIVLTHDLDFGAILAASGGKGPSVVQIRADNIGVQAIGMHVVTALHQSVDELVVGALMTIEPGRLRLTLLPLTATTRQSQ